MFPVMRFLVGLSVVLVLYVGGRAILSNSLTLGDFVEINARILQLAWPAMSVGFVMSIYSRGRASLVRINQLLAHKPQIADGAKNLGRVNELSVYGLKLNEDLRDDKGISFSLKRGQFLGVVGQSGSYKTKLLRTLYRRETTPAGTIFLNGHDINEISLSSIYNQVSVASAETFLFHKTIRENICFLKPHASNDEINVVMKILRLDRDITNFKDGLDTIIGERGITLSGGQRQRIALARILLAKKSINILDDALSAVDAQTERHIVIHLKEYLKDSMLIVASHRLSAILGADHILVLEHGRIAEQGNHRHLVNISPLYQSLWGIDQLTERLI
jgi:ATP-binding cassette subfamily B multidrug efflux pump